MSEEQKWEWWFVALELNHGKSPAKSKTFSSVTGAMQHVTETSGHVFSAAERLEIHRAIADDLTLLYSDGQMAIVALELSNAEVERANTEPASRQVMDINTLRDWLLALDIPNVTDIYQPNATNFFYVSFHKILFPDDYRKLAALGLTVEPTSIRARYMVTWSPPKDEEA